MKKHTKRIVSYVLVLAMLFSVAYSGGMLAGAASVKSADTELKDLYFLVPETIYLSPSATAYTNNQSYTAVGYENMYWPTGAPSFVPNQTLNTTTGLIYFCLYQSSASGTLTWRFVDLDSSTNKTYSGGSITVTPTNGDLVSGATGTASITTSTSKSSIRARINGITTPSLESSVKGCYIEWCVSYTDPIDGLAKKAYNYSYCYKPYSRPVFASSYVRAAQGIYTYLDTITWISGIQGVVADNGNRGIVASTFFPLGGVIPTPTGTDVASTSGQIGLSGDPSSFASSTATPKTGLFDSKDKAAGNVQVQVVSPVGKLVVDTSRYKDLSKVPNLKVGHEITRVSEGSGSVGDRWFGYYLMDFSTEYNRGNFIAPSSSSSSDKTYYTNYRKVTDGVYMVQNIDYDEGGATRSEDSSKPLAHVKPGVKYNSVWSRPISANPGQVTTTTVAIAGGVRYGCKDKPKIGSATNSSSNASNIVPLELTLVNKSALRTAVQNANIAQAKYGVTSTGDGYLKWRSCYFETSGVYAWENFQNAYSAAVKALLNPTYSTDDIAVKTNNLTNAMDQLKTKVFFRPNGGTIGGTVGSSETSVAVKIGTPTGVNSSTSYDTSSTFTASRQGYTFVGWNTDAGATTGSTNLTIGYNNVFYAIWKQNAEARFWRIEGNSVTKETVYATLYGAQTYTVTASQPPTQISYNGRTLSWLGFTTETTADSTTSYSSERTYEISGNMDFNSLYSCNISLQFNANGGTNAPSQQTLKLYLNANSSGITTNGASFVISSIVPIKPGYSFVGWSLSPTASEADYQPGDTIDDVASGTTLYAVWNENMYYVHYIGGGATSGSMDNSIHYYGIPSLLNKNNYVREYNVTFNTRDGNANTSAKATAEFIGWATTSNGNVAYGDEQSVLNLTKSDGATVNLYAKWTLGSVELPDPVRTGYAFRGWYTNSSLTNLAGYGGESYTPLMNTILYAMWDANSYKVVYNGNGATSGSTPISDHVYDQASPLSPNGFSQVYTVTYAYNDADGGEMPLTASAVSGFAGWAASPNGDALYYDGESVTNLIESGATILYAKWLPGNVNLPAPEKSGFTFAGWYSDADLTVPAGSASAYYTVTSDVTLYAKWEKSSDPRLVASDDSQTIVDSESHFIYGLPCRDESEQTDLIAAGLCDIADGNGYVTYEYSNPDNVIGTGTKVILHSRDGSVLDTYVVVIFGDNDGDGYITLNDCIDGEYYSAYMDSDHDYDDLTDPCVYAMDLDGDGSVTSNDFLIVAYYAAWILPSINQTGPTTA